MKCIFIFVVLVYSSQTQRTTTTQLAITSLTNSTDFPTTIPTTSARPLRRRIIGGFQVRISDFPFVSCLILKESDEIDNFRGGATIISDHWVLTAAHCMEYISDDAIREKEAFVRSNTANWHSGYKDHLIIKSHVHEKYDEETLDFDIAVLKVSTAFTGKREKPVKFARENYNYAENTKVIALGWGTTTPNVDGYVFPVDQLRAVSINIVNFKRCKQNYGTQNELITERMICAISPGKDACVFDSGGPLYQNKTLVGIVSWGTKVCATSKFPGIYTRVSLFHKWIDNKINK